MPTLDGSPSLFYSSQTGYDYWNNYSPAFTQEFGLNIGVGNLTSSPTVNSLLQAGNGLYSYGAVPTAVALAGGDPQAALGFGRLGLAHNPGDMTSTQLNPMGQAITGQTNLPLLPYQPFEQTGYPTTGDFYAGVAGFNLVPGASNYMYTSNTSALAF